MKQPVFYVTIGALAGLLFAQAVLALTVSPVRVEMMGDPGQTLAGEIIVLNEQKEIKTFYSSFENFEAQGESGTPNFTPGKDGLATWIKAPTEVILEPQEKKTIPFTVTIPKDADAGGHFAAIFWSTTPPNVGNGQVAVGAKVGSLILLKVNGDIKEGGGLLEFETENNRRFFTSFPVTFDYRFQNSGNDRVNPHGAIEIKNTFGFTSINLNANPSEGNVLPDTVRKFTASWDEGDDSHGFFGMVKKEWQHFAFGWYTAHLELHYGQQDQVAQASYHFFMVPWQLLSIVLIVLAIILLVGFFGIKKYNRWIIEAARRK